MHARVAVLDGKIGDGAQSRAQVQADPAKMFPGDNLSQLEFTPKPEYTSAGLPTSTLARKKSDLVVVRVTDETVPDAGKKRYTVSLSIHGIERAGAGGGHELRGHGELHRPAADAGDGRLHDGREGTRGWRG
jgi:hypothetical protein